MSMSFPVALIPCSSYELKPLSDAVDAAFAACGYAPRPGDKVLLKPNLLTAGPALTCTQAEVAAAAAAWLLDHSARLVVADSPGFGSARRVAEAVGIRAALDALPGGKGIPVEDLARPVAVPLSKGGHIAISRTALEVDALVNLPRLKAHKQMRVSAAVKNCFGCVSSVRKALAHARLGERGTAFESMLLDIARILPIRANLLDAVVAMNRTGPMDGEPLQLGFIAAARNPVALDTALYSLLGLEPGRVALWAEALRRGLPEADIRNIVYPSLTPEALDGSSFTTPDELMAVSFRPAALLRSLCRRLKAKAADRRLKR